MARIPPIDLEKAPEETARILGNLPVVLNIFRTMAWAETSFAAQLRLGASILTAQQLDARAREHIILAVAALDGGKYEWIQHVPISLACGCSQAEIDAIEIGELDSDCFDERDRALLAFVRESVRNVKCEDATFAALRKHFDEREIVEIILTVGFYMTMVRLTENCETPLDQAAGMAVVDSAKRSDQE